MDKSSLISAVAGLSGSLSSLILYPLEFVKINIMAGDGHSKNFIPRYRNARHAFMSIYETKGLLHFYKGCHMTLFSSIAWSLYFYEYDIAKKRYSNLKDNYPNTYKFTVAADAAILSRFITSPIWTVKTRLILQQNSTYWYGDTLEVVKKIWKLDGIKGFFAGLVPGLMLCSNGAFNLYFYEMQKEIIHNHSTLFIGLIGMNSKLLASILTYPLQLIMINLQQEQYTSTIHIKSSRLQQEITKNKFFSGTLHCVKKTFHNEGIKGFYRGLSIQMMRTVPGNGLFFMLYESTLNAFKDL